MKTTLLLLALILSLSGCGLCPTKTITVKVEVPVPVPCKVASPTKPVYPLQESKKEEDIFNKTKKAIAEIELRKGYETELEAAVKSCQ